MIRKIFTFWLNGEALMLAFGLGAVTGMLVEALFITVPGLALSIIGAVL